MSDGTQAQGDVVIPETIVIDGLNYEVTKIGDRAFAQNAQLTSIDLSNTNLSSSGALGASCFEGCSALTQVLFPDNGSKLSIGRSAFRDCTALTSLTLYDFQVAKKNQPFNESGIRQITTTSITSLGQDALNGLPDGFTLTCLDSMNVSRLDKYTFGKTTNVTFHVPAAYVDQLTDYFYGDVHVEALQEAVAFLEDGSGSVTGYASLAEAFAAINASSAQGPFTLTVKSGLSTADAYVEYPSTILTKETVIDFQGNSVDLPDTLTLNAPLTIRNVTNFDRQTLCTVDAGTHAFVLENGGSFGFSQISGSDLTFVGKLPGSTPTGEGVVIEGVGADASIHLADIGSSSYYYDLPAIEGFADLQLSNAYLEVSAEQMQDLQAIAMDQAGLWVSGDARIEELSGNGELRLAEDASLYVTRQAQGTYRMPEVSGQSAPITLPKDSAITITNQNGEAITYAVPAILVSGGDLASASFVDMEEAFAAIAADTQTDAVYTITLLDDVQLEETLVLPNTAIVLDGAQHTIREAADGSTIDVKKALTIRNAQLELSDSVIHYAPISGTKDRWIRLEETVSGSLKEILDDSQHGYLDISLYPSVQVERVVGTSRSSGSRLTDLILNGYQDTADLPEIVNMAAVELAGCTLTISGDQSNLGTIRTSEDATVSTLRISGDTTLERLSIGNNDNFALVFAPDAQLQLLENSHWSQYAPIEVTVEGDPQDGTPLIRNLTSEEGNSFTLAQGTDTMALYWDAASESLCVSRAPQIAVSADSQGSAGSYRAITLQVSDAQQIDHLLINGERVEIDAAQTIIDENSEYLQEGENTIEAVDVSGLRSTFTFTLDRQAPQIQIIESEGSEGIYRTLSLLLSDTDQLDKMILNGQEVSLSSLEYTLTQEHASIQEGANVLEVFDRAGNRASITFTIDTTAPKLQASIQDDVLTITADEAITIEGEGWQRQSDTVWTYVITQETSIDVLATDPAGNTASLRVQVPSLPTTPQTPQEEEPDKDSPTVEPSDEQDVQTAAAAFASLYGAAGVIAVGMSAWLKKRKNRK